MKKKQFKRFIAWGFTVLAVFLIASFSVPVCSYASSTTSFVFSVPANQQHGYNLIIYYGINTTNRLYYGEFLDSSTYTVNLSLNYGDSFSFYIYRLKTSGTGVAYSYVSSSYSSDSSNPSVIDLGSTIFISLNNQISGTSGKLWFLVNDSTPTPTPDPTPTPTPTAPPTPTQDPTITSDIQFWGRVNTNANGFWQVLTQIFNGIFNNVVMRNMIVYIPLFGLIITLVVYLFTFGGRHD